MSFDLLELLFALLTIAGGGALVYRRGRKERRSRAPVPPKPPKTPASTVADETETKVTNAIADGNDVLETVDEPATGDPGKRWRDF